MRRAVLSGLSNIAIPMAQRSVLLPELLHPVLLVGEAAIANGRVRGTRTCVSDTTTMLSASEGMMWHMMPPSSPA
jgi:hypothetical protein